MIQNAFSAFARPLVFPTPEMMTMIIFFQMWTSVSWDHIRVMLKVAV